MSMQAKRRELLAKRNELIEAQKSEEMFSKLADSYRDKIHRLGLEYNEACSDRNKAHDKVQRLKSDIVVLEAEL